MSDLEKLGIPKLNDSNYSTWSTKFEFLLMTKGWERALTDEKSEHDGKVRAHMALGVEEQHLPTIKGLLHGQAGLEGA